MSPEVNRGTIVTFYSWKGGVGRTMALVNIGVQLARRNDRVLLVDWDLEAPGLTRYIFRPSADSIDLQISGAIGGDGFVGLLDQAAREAQPQSDALTWQSRIIRVSNDQSGVLQNKSEKHWEIDIIPSGYGLNTYAETLAKFSWSDFFQYQNGGAWLESLRNQWAANYDFVLIDSRTGLTDSGGVCTIQMPDVLALVFTANNQSLEGGLQVVQAAQSSRTSFTYERGQLVVLPILSRWEGDREVDLAELWISKFDQVLRPTVSSWLPKFSSPREFLEKTRIPHVARFSFGEPLPVLSHSLSDPSLPGVYFDTIAGIIHSKFDEVQKLLTPPPLISSTNNLRAFVLRFIRKEVYLAVEATYGNMSHTEGGIAGFDMHFDASVFESSVTSSMLENGIISSKDAPPSRRDLTRRTETIGSELFRLVFKPPIETLYREALRVGRQTSQGVDIRVVLPLNDAALSSYPWEALFDPVERSFLATMPGAIFTRNVDESQGDKYQQASFPVSILVVNGYDRSIDFDGANRNLTTALNSRATSLGMGTLRFSRSTPSSLITDLRMEPYTILIYTGSVGYDPEEKSGYVILHGDDVRSVSLYASDLKDLLEISRDIRLVIIISTERDRQPACFIAQELVSRGIPGAVYMGLEVSDTSVVGFVASLVAHLADRASIQTAVALARQELRLLHGDVGWLAPVLYLPKS